MLIFQGESSHVFFQLFLRFAILLYPRRKGHRQSRLSFKSGTSGADEVKSMHSGQKATVQDMEVPRFALKKQGTL